MTEEIPVDTAEEFVSLLRPSHARWWNAKASVHTHYFRGHANKDWDLLPAGLRPLDANHPLLPLFLAFLATFEEAGFGSFSNSKPSASTRARAWLLALWEASNRFSDLGRQVGLETTWHTENSYLTPSRCQLFPPQVELNLAALAQHHSIPTHLLDWSEDPLTAAYFSLGDKHATDLCVWALEVPDGVCMFDGYDTQIVLAKARTAGNSNIRAQNGVFLHYWGMQFDPVFDGYNWKPFDAHPRVAEALTKITLPASQREVLRDLLLAERRSAAHLMPSWDNVTKTLLRQWTDALEGIDFSAAI